MTDEILIDQSDFLAIRNLSKQVKAEKFMPFISEAQMFDVRPFLGAPMYYDLLKNKTSDKYKNLLLGMEYNDPSNNPVKFIGLKSAIAYYAFSRYVMDEDSESTATGFVKKTNEFSTPASDKSLARKSDAARNVADAIMQDIKRFLDLPANKTVYPLWSSPTDCSQNTSVNFNMSGISRV